MVKIFGDLQAHFAGRVPVAPSPPDWSPRLPSVDSEAELALSCEARAVPVGDSLRGVTLILNYFDAQEAESTRQVSCGRLVQANGALYLRAFCHQRRAPRSFRVDRIAGVYDVVTGEHLGQGSAFFSHYVADRLARGAGEWGLLPDQRAGLGAGLIALTFLSRCDGHRHPLESEEIETFAAGWWMRAEIAAAFPETAIAERAKRLAPDIETLEFAAHRVRGDRLLRPMVAGYARRLVEADGRIAEQEQDWILRLVQWWEG